MWRTALGAFLIAHGVLTAIIWSAPPGGEAPMTPGRSWLLGDARLVSVVLAVVSGLLIVASGVGVLGHRDWWSAAGLAGGVLSLVLFLLFFSLWWLIGIAISSALVVAALRDRLGG
jgi:hypothetical protein